MLGGRFSYSMGLLGVDWGTSAIRMLQVRQQEGELHVVGAGEVPLPTGAGADDASATKLSECIRATFASGGFTGRRCVVSLPREEVCIQSVRLPKMPDDELRQAAAWEASQRFGFDHGAMEIEALRTGASLQSGENREEVLLVAASHAVLKPRLKIIMDAGLRPLAVDTDFAALARIFSRQHRREADLQHVRAVLDIGRSGSTLMILRGSQVSFCKPLALGGGKFDEAVADHLQMDVAAASELRAGRILNATTGSNGAAPIDPSTERAVYDAVRPLIGELVKEVTLCLRYYGVTFRGRPPSQIIIAGGDGLEPNLGEMIGAACKIPVVYDDEEATLATLDRDIHAALHRVAGPGACWAVAAGLSIRGMAAPNSAATNRRGAAA